MNMKSFIFLVLISIIFLGFVPDKKKNNSGFETMRSPENQVFQFMQTDTCRDWADGSQTQATAYLWVPENCQKLRGLLIMCTNVPEHMLVGHPAIRKACSNNNLGIIWCTPSFMNFRKSTIRDGRTINMALEYKTITAFLQKLLNGLAKTSGYSEVATVPWLPMGESGHLLMVDALVENNPEKCIAGIWIKNNHFPPKNRITPALVAFGSAQEWGQDKTDISSQWNNVGDAYNYVLNERGKNPNWPLSYVIDGTSGHFDCSERLVNYFARYIDLVSKARLSHGDTLNRVDLRKGFVVDLPVPGHENHRVKAYSGISSTVGSVPWYFSKDQAKEAQSIASINWNAETQLPAFLTDSGKVAPFSFNGISKVTPTHFEADGITFTVKCTMLDKLPDNFYRAGKNLPQSAGPVETEWVCGQFKPLGNSRFQIALDRSWNSTANYIGIRKKGNNEIREIFQPCGLTLQKNNEGKPQVIIFQKIPDVPAGTRTLRLSAHSDAGLPVKFFVVSGPAIIKNDRLIFTQIPPRTIFPVAVTVAAWQWGRNTEPKVKTANLIKQTFYIFSVDN